MYQMDEKTIGTNAGKVWHVLHDKEIATRYQIINETAIEASEVDAALGWLARENKVCRNGEFFLLGDTNMEQTIGLNAEILFNVLKTVPYSLSALHEITDLNTIEIHQAIGWLSRAGDINLTSEPEVSELFDEHEETMHHLKNEVDMLQTDIEKRNEIICQLSRQLTEKQTEFIQQAHMVNHMTDELEKKDAIVALRNVDLSEKNEQIFMLHQEIESLHGDIHSRNQIITDLSKQLTTTQLESIKQSHAFTELQRQVAHGKPAMKTSAQTSIQQRLEHVSTIQQNLDAQAELQSLDNESRLYHASSPVLDIQQQQEVESPVVRPKTLDEIHQTVDQVISEKIQKLRDHQ
jgi:hypothetical protein